jgi:IclR family transcriptional regulator, KDG regulon repressor
VLEREVAGVQKLGYAVNDGETEVGVRAVARVVHRDDRLGIDVALTVAGPEERLPLERLEAVAGTVAALAAERSGRRDRSAGVAESGEDRPAAVAPAAP